MAQYDPFDSQGAADRRVRRDFWILALLFLPDILDLARSRSWSEFWHKLVRKIRNLIIAIILVGALCIVLGETGIGRPTVPDFLTPQPPGGCPPPIATAIAAWGIYNLRSAANDNPSLLPSYGVTPIQATALARYDYDGGCPQG